MILYESCMGFPFSLSYLSVLCNVLQYPNELLSPALPNTLYNCFKEFSLCIEVCLQSVQTWLINEPRNDFNWKWTFCSNIQKRHSALAQGGNPHYFNILEITPWYHLCIYNFVFSSVCWFILVGWSSFCSFFLFLQVWMRMTGEKLHSSILVRWEFKFVSN